MMYFLGSIAAMIFLCWCCIIQLQLYQMCPGWGPIRKFDSDGTEEMRINQLLMHEERHGVAHNRIGEKAKDENLAFFQGLVSSTQRELQGQVKNLDKTNLDKSDVERARPESGGVAVGKINDNGLYTGFQES